MNAIICSRSYNCNNKCWCWCWCSCRKPHLLFDRQLFSFFFNATQKMSSIVQNLLRNQLLISTVIFVFECKRVSLSRQLTFTVVQSLPQERRLSPWQTSFHSTSLPPDLKFIFSLLIWIYWICNQPTNRFLFGFGVDPTSHQPKLRSEPFSSLRANKLCGLFQRDGFVSITTTTFIGPKGQ